MVSIYCVLRGDPEKRSVVAGKCYWASSPEEAIRMWEADTEAVEALEEILKQENIQATGYYTTRWDNAWVEPRWHA